MPNFENLARTEKAYFVPYAFVLDDGGSDWFSTHTFILPLVETPDTYDSGSHSDIWGLFLQIETTSSQGVYFKRVGFGMVTSTDGHIAYSGHYLDDWTPPLWSEDDLEIITIV